MKPIPEEIAYRIANASYNPFFYLQNGKWNKENFEKLLRKNYTLPSLIRRLLHGKETKILRRLLPWYEEEIHTLPASLQNDIYQLLSLSKPLSSFSSLPSRSFISSSSSTSLSPYSSPTLSTKRKFSESTIASTINIPQLKTLTLEDIEKGLPYLLQHQLSTGEYTYLREEEDMSQFVSGLQVKFEEIKEKSIADANGGIASFTRKTENPEYSFMYLYGLMSSLNFQKGKNWNHDLLTKYHPSFIRVKVTEEVLDSFKYLNNAFECTEVEMIKPTYTVVKEMYEECHQRIKIHEYMSFIFDHQEYGPIILDTLNNLPLITWKVFHTHRHGGERKESMTEDHSHYREMETEMETEMENDDEDKKEIKMTNNNDNNDDNNNDNNNVIPLPELPDLPSDQHNILYILTHNFFLGMYPSCHLFYLYDQYIEDIQTFYDEDNHVLYKYYSGIASSPDNTLLAFYHYTALILLLRSPHIRCLFEDPEAELRARREQARQLRQYQPQFLSALSHSKQKVIYVGNPLAARTINIERFLPHLASTSNDDEKEEEEKEEQGKEHEKEKEKEKERKEKEEENENVENNDREAEKQFKIHIPNPQIPIAYITDKNKKEESNSQERNPLSILATSSSSSSTSMIPSVPTNHQESLDHPSTTIIHSSPSSSSSSLSSLQMKKVMVVVKNNLLSFTSQRREWRIQRRHSLTELEDELELEDEVKEEEEEEEEKLKEELKRPEDEQDRQDKRSKLRMKMRTMSSNTYNSMFNTSTTTTTTTTTEVNSEFKHEKENDTRKIQWHSR